MIYGAVVEGGLYGIRDMLNTSVSGAFEKIPQFWLFLALAVIAAIVGLFGVRLLKVISAVGCAVIGYFAGDALYALLTVNSEVMSTTFSWLGYAAGGVLALLLLFLGYKRSTYVFGMMMAAAGYYCVYSFVDPQPVLALAGGLLSVLLVMFILKYAIIIISALAGGFLGLNFISMAFPKFTQIRLTQGNGIAFLIAGSLSLFFLVVQLITTRKYRFK